MSQPRRRLYRRRPNRSLAQVSTPLGEPTAREPADCDLVHHTQRRRAPAQQRRLAVPGPFSVRQIDDLTSEDCEGALRDRVHAGERTSDIDGSLVDADSLGGIGLSQLWGPRQQFSGRGVKCGQPVAAASAGLLERSGEVDDRVIHVDIVRTAWEFRIPWKDGGGVWLNCGSTFARLTRNPIELADDIERVPRESEAVHVVVWLRTPVRQDSAGGEIDRGEVFAVDAANGIEPPTDEQLRRR